MYEIYINDRPLRLVVSGSPESTATLVATHLVANYSGKAKTLLNYADLLEKGSPKVTAVTLVAKDLDILWKDFTAHYKIVEAAGGVVNLAGTKKYLFIYRRGYLDLPKGKIDKGETKAGAALREVMEETGLSEVSINEARRQPNYPPTSLPAWQTTYHTYRTKKGKRILKPTYWFEMTSTQRELTPETEEGIEWARWLTIKEAMNGGDSFYSSLYSLLE